MPILDANTLDFISHSPEQTRRIGMRLGALLNPGDVICLQGDLGAGKTTFARALIQALGHKGRVKSPTYGLLESYQTGGFNILHLDLYRIEAPGELDFLGLRDLFDNKSILLIEWPEKGGEFIPRADLLMQFGEDNEQRFVALRVISSAGRKVVARL